MLEDLSSKDKVVGLKQVRRAIACGRAGHVFLARDADPRLPGRWRIAAGRLGFPLPGGHHGPAGPCLRHRRTHGRSGALAKENRFQRNKISCSVENIGSYPTNL